MTAILAMAGYDVLLIDGNTDQGTASNWAARRDNIEGVAPVVCVEKSGNIYKSVTALSEKYDVTLIDTGGQDSKELRTSMPAADLLISPVRPSQADLETLVYMDNLVEQARDLNPDLKASVVITNAPSNPKIKLLAEAREALQDLEQMKLMDTVIYIRKAYTDALTCGMGVPELRPKNKKAIGEIEALAMEIGFNHYTHEPEEVAEHLS
jgi:chromosome partitioning protein